MVWVRNVLYDLGWFSSKKGAVPTVVIGNVHVGGTGKTPHTLWLANALKADFNLAILSRGYGRKTSGYLEWKLGMTAADFGDEPCQYAHAFPDLRVVVCEDRLAGIDRIAQSGEEQLVLLDDALQHRRLRGDVNVVLMRESELPQHSSYLPSGNLRDHLRRLKASDVVVVTGAKAHWTATQLAELKATLKLPEACFMTSSVITYDQLRDSKRTEVAYPKQAIVVTGIANPSPFLAHLAEHTEIVEHFNYADHHSFTSNDWNNWIQAVSERSDIPVITTEKDYMRMMDSDQLEKLNVLYNPIAIEVANPSLIVEMISKRILPKK